MEIISNQTALENKPKYDLRLYCKNGVNKKQFYSYLYTNFKV